jgi:small-conductance mechanosensitive channel
MMDGNITGMLTNLSQIDLVQILLILAGTWLLIMVSQRLLTWFSGALSGRSRLLVLAAVPVIRLLVIFTAVALLVPRLVEPTFENLVALLGAAGLALGFAFKDYISSLIAGIVTLWEMPYRLGDWIEVDGVYGEVKAIGMRAAEIVTLDDTVVVIPHLMLWDRLIHNANDGTTHLLCVTDFYLHPQHDAAAVQAALHDVALTSPYLDVAQPITVITLEKPWGTHYRLKAYPVDPRQQMQFRTDLTVRGKAALVALGATFATAPAIAEMAS